MYVKEVLLYEFLGRAVSLNVEVPLEALPQLYILSIEFLILVR